MPSPDHTNTHILSSKTHNAKVTECTPCVSDLKSYEIDYDEVSECTEPLVDSHHKLGWTAKGNEVSPAKMPLMRIRSVEIVFEDEMSTCTDTGLLDRSIEFIVTDSSSDDSTKCMDDIENVQVEKYDNDANDDSVTLNADGNLSDDNSVSITKDDAINQEKPKVDTPQSLQDVGDTTHVPSEITLGNDDATLSLNASEVADSGRFTGEASSSHFESIPLTYEDALLSHSFDVINVDQPSTVLDSHGKSDAFVTDCKSRLYEYIDSNSDSSDDTAVCDVDNSQVQNVTPLHNAVTVSDEDHTVCDGSDLQYDSFVDMGKF